ncbi:hypothetical protein DSECCO2_605960 [anaerobic digester metagenome]
MLTRVQKGFYFVPSLPFFAVGFAILIAPVIHQWISKIKTEGKLHKTLIASGSVLLLAALVFSFMQAGKTRRNKEILHDVYAIGQVVPTHTTVSVPDFETWNQWDLQSYFMRYFNISLDDKTKNHYLIIDRKKSQSAREEYSLIPLSTLRYDLYSLQK